MSSTYREIAPSPRLSAFVECFWVRDITRDVLTRVLPDGCADILFYTRGPELIKAEVVGVMTGPRDVPLEDGESILGVRFHPGMAGACLPCDVPTLNDQVVPIQAIWGSASSELIKGVRDGASMESRIEALEDRLARLPRITQVQRAIGELVGRRGQITVADLAEAAGLGERQLRRACLRHSGLSPKQLARILRFRQAVERLRGGVSDMAGLALDCGYYDQGHMIRDFRELAGVTPARYMRELRG